MDSNKKPVTEAEGRLQTVISELDITISDLLDKAGFTLMELMEVAVIRANDTTDDKAKNLNRVNGLADIAYDYVARTQSALTSLILRERREGGQETLSPAAASPFPCNSFMIATSKSLQSGLLYLSLIAADSLTARIQYSSLSDAS